MASPGLLETRTQGRAGPDQHRSLDRIEPVRSVQPGPGRGRTPGAGQPPCLDLADRGQQHRIGLRPDPQGGFDALDDLGVGLGPKPLLAGLGQDGAGPVQDRRSRRSQQRTHTLTIDTGSDIFGPQSHCCPRSLKKFELPAVVHSENHN